MKKIVEELEVIRTKTKYNKSLQKQKQLRSPKKDDKYQKLSPRKLIGVKVSTENPFDSKVVESPEAFYTNENEGNVFDTVEQF